MSWVGDLIGTEFTRERAFDAMLGPARAYAIARWRVDNDVYFNADDRAAIAWSSLSEVLNDIEFHSWPYLWVSVKSRIDSDMTHALRKHANRLNDKLSIAPKPGGWEDAGNVFTALRTQHRDGLLHGQLADTIAVLPRINKIALALRFFEMKSLGEIGGLIGASEKPARTWITANTRYLLYVAKRLVLDHGPNDPVRVPRVIPAYQDALEAAAEQYTQTQHGCDVSSWLGWAQRSYRADVTYILDMLDVGNGIRIKTSLRGVKLDYEADADVLDELATAPTSVADVMSATGWAHSRSRYAIATWRLRHGIDAPKNGAEARSQADEFAA